MHRRLAATAVAVVLVGCHEGRSLQDAGAAVGYVSLTTVLDTNCALHGGRWGVCWGAGYTPPISVGNSPSLVVTDVDDVKSGDVSLIVRRGGVLECDKGPTYTLYSPPFSPPGDVAEFAVGVGHVCAFGNDGIASCWDYPPFSASPPEVVPAPVPPLKAIRIQSDTPCGLTLDGQAICWNPMATTLTPAGDEFPPTLPPGLYVDAVMAPIDGGACAIDSTGEVRCVYGRCYVDSSTAAVICRDVLNLGVTVGPAPPGPFAKLVSSQGAQGKGFMCGLRPDGDVACWGQDAVPVVAAQPQGLRFRDLSAGNAHLCGITLDGKLMCWGDNQYGQGVAPVIDSDAGVAP